MLVIGYILVRSNDLICKGDTEGLCDKWCTLSWRMGSKGGEGENFRIDIFGGDVSESVL